MAGIRRRQALGLAVSRLARAQPGQRLAIATGTVGGGYYPLGGGLANLQLLGANRVGMVFTQVDTAMDALRDEDRFRNRAMPVRAVAVLYTNRMQVVTTAASGIQRFEDLKGKRISSGVPGSWTEVVTFRPLEAARLDKDRDFRARERLSPNESSNAMKDGKLDPFFFTGRVPTGGIMDLAATAGTEIRLLDHGHLVPALIRKSGPAHVAEAIPPGSFPS